MVDRNMVVGHIPMDHMCSFMCTNHIDMKKSYHKVWAHFWWLHVPPSMAVGAYVSDWFSTFIPVVPLLVFLDFGGTLGVVGFSTDLNAFWCSRILSVKLYSLRKQSPWT